MTNILTAAEAANYLRTETDDAAMLDLLPVVDGLIQSATGRDWSSDASIHPVAKAAAGMYITLLYDNPSQLQKGSESVLPYGLTDALAKLEAEALKYRKHQFEGISGAGDISLPGALMGDDVVKLVGVYGATGDQSSAFEAAISDNDVIAQTSGSDLTDKLFVVVLKSPKDDVLS